MGVFDQIKTGLEEAIAYERGTGTARVTKLSVTPVESFEADEIKNIRRRTGLTQSVFAQFMGVSVKTVEAWENGRNKPAGAACRLLKMTQSNPEFPVQSGIVAL